MKELQEFSSKLFTAVESWIKERWHKPIPEPADDIIDRFYRYWLNENERMGFDALCEELGEEVVYMELRKVVEVANQDIV